MMTVQSQVAWALAAVIAGYYVVAYGPKAIFDNKKMIIHQKDTISDYCNKTDPWLV